MTERSQLLVAALVILVGIMVIQSIRSNDDARDTALALQSMRRQLDELSGAEAGSRAELLAAQEALKKSQAEAEAAAIRAQSAERAMKEAEEERQAEAVREAQAEREAEQALQLTKAARAAEEALAIAKAMREEQEEREEREALEALFDEERDQIDDEPERPACAFAMGRHPWLGRTSVYLVLSGSLMTSEKCATMAKTMVGEGWVEMRVIEPKGRLMCQLQPADVEHASESNGSLVLSVYGEPVKSNENEYVELDETICNRFQELGFVPYYEYE